MSYLLPSAFISRALLRFIQMYYFVCVCVCVITNKFGPHAHSFNFNFLLFQKIFIFFYSHSIADFVLCLRFTSRRSLSVVHPNTPLHSTPLPLSVCLFIRWIAWHKIKIMARKMAQTYVVYVCVIVLVCAIHLQIRTTCSTWKFMRIYIFFYTIFRFNL